MEAAQTVTGADGVYGFLGIASGDYSIEVVPPTGVSFEVVPPTGVSFSPQNVGGDDLIDSDVDRIRRLICA